MNKKKESHFKLQVAELVKKHGGEVEFRNKRVVIITFPGCHSVELEYADDDGSPRLDLSALFMVARK